MGQSKALTLATDSQVCKCGECISPSSHPYPPENKGCNIPSLNLTPPGKPAGGGLPKQGLICLIATLAILNTTITTYDEVLAQHCLANTLWDLNHALCDQLLCTQARISGFELKDKDGIHGNGALPQKSHVQQYTRELKRQPSKQQEDPCGILEPQLHYSPKIPAFLLLKQFQRLEKCELKQNKSVFVEFATTLVRDYVLSRS